MVIVFVDVPSVIVIVPGIAPPVSGRNVGQADEVKDVLPGS